MSYKYQDLSKYPNDIGKIAILSYLSLEVYLEIYRLIILSARDSQNTYLHIKYIKENLGSYILRINTKIYQRFILELPILGKLREGVGLITFHGLYN